MSYTNREVILCWSKGEPARNANLRTDGVGLWSYELLIGTRDGNIRIVYGYLSDFGHFRSVTTSRHVGVAMVYANEIVDPETGLKLHPRDELDTVGDIVRKELATHSRQ